MSSEMTIGFIGTPNCGKTTLFNAFTGANLKVANWPGVTVEKVEGAIKRHDMLIHLVDLPGTYSLTSYTMEEFKKAFTDIGDATADGLAANAILVSNVAAAIALIVWTVLDTYIVGKPTVLGAISGAVAGLVAITPAAGFVDVSGALVIGAVASLVSYVASKS